MAYYVINSEVYVYKNIGFLIGICLWSLSANSAYKMDAKLKQYHSINSQVAKLLNPKNASQITKLISSTRSPQDRKMFEKSYISIKGKKIFTMPFMDRLIITDGGKRYVIQLLTIKPLKVKVNDFAIVTIDTKNIYNSVAKVMNKPSTAALWNTLLPSANAFWSSGESSWLFMFSAVASSVAESKDYSGKLAVDDAAFSDEVDAFIKKYDIKNFNCSSANMTSIGNTKARGLSFTDSKDNRYFARCASSASDCFVLPTDKSGNFNGLVDQLKEQEIKLKNAMKVEAQKLANNPQFNINDFDVRCEMVWNGWKTSKYPACYFDQLNGSYTPEAIDALKTTNLLPDSAYEDQSIVDAATARIDALSATDKSELNGDQGFILSSLEACCKDEGCKAKAKDRLPMSNRAPAIEQ